MNSFFPSDPSRDAGDIFTGSSAASPSQQMNFQQQSGSIHQLEMLENLLMQDAAAQLNQQQHPQSSTTPQAVLERRVKINQLQQLQLQLQQQIFQEQLELYSGGQPVMNSLPPMLDPSRDTPQFGLPTPISSTELRAQPNSEFVSPMLLHSNGNSIGSISHTSGMVPDFLSQLSHHMPPSAPHSAPANIVFDRPAYPLPSPNELSELPSIPSPMLEPYHHAPTPLIPAGSSMQATARMRGVGAKRPNASSSGDESSVTNRPPRKRPSVSDKNGSSGSRKMNTRASHSATSTPVFPATAPPSVRPSPIQSSMPGSSDIMGDTPSPVEPPMPPPAHLPPDAPLSAISGPSTSPTPPLPPGSTSPNFGPTIGTIERVTPASMFNLNRLTVPSGGSAQSNNQDVPEVPKQKERRSSTRTTGSSSSKSKAADKASGGHLISPALKPIRPAGNAVVTPVSTSPSTPFMPPQVRKSSHKAAEQKRRDSLKTSFDDLRILLPPIPLPSEEGFPDEPILPGAMPPRGPPKGNAEGPNRGVSKLQLLRCGNEFIKVLKGRLERRDDEIVLLRQEVCRLRGLVGEEASAPPDGQEMIDLERDLDACELSANVFGRAASRAMSVGDGDGDDDGDS